MLRLHEQVVHDRLSIVAAGVAFYALLAVFPALAALVALYGLLFDTGHVSRQIAALSAVLPRQALDVLLDQLSGLALTPRDALGWGAVGGLALTLWSASRGTRTLMVALNVAYGVREKRTFLKRHALALSLTLGAIVGAVAAIAAVVFLPALVRFVGLAPHLQGLVTFARWPVLALAATAGAAILYRFGPSREHASWTGVAAGAVLATALWLAGSALFSLYVSSYEGFNETYGSIAAIVILLLWFLLSAYAVLLGAELSAELARGSRCNADTALARSTADG